MIINPIDQEFSQLEAKLKFDGYFLNIKVEI